MSDPADEYVPKFDAARLIAEIRRGDGRALEQAYAYTFGNELGRLVLAHHLAECGVGNALGAENLKYAAGKHDGALSLASKAGFDQASLAVAVLSDELEERATDETSQFRFEGVAGDEDLGPV